MVNLDNVGQCSSARPSPSSGWSWTADQGYGTVIMMVLECLISISWIPFGNDHPPVERPFLVKKVKLHRITNYFIPKSEGRRRRREAPRGGQRGASGRLEGEGEANHVPLTCTWAFDLAWVITMERHCGGRDYSHCLLPPKSQRHTTTYHWCARDIHFSLGLTEPFQEHPSNPLAVVTTTHRSHTLWHLKKRVLSGLESWEERTSHFEPRRNDQQRF